MVIFMANIYYCKKIQSKIRKTKKVLWNEVQRNPGASFQKTSSSGIKKGIFNSPNTEL